MASCVGFGQRPFHIREVAAVPRHRSGLNARMPSLHVARMAFCEETQYGEANSTRCPGFQHHHWQHHDAGLESSARDGVPWQQRPLDIHK
jgi:hypothetical protein